MDQATRISNQLTQFQARSIASWSADFGKMKEVGLAAALDPEEREKRENALEDFYNLKGKPPNVHRTNGNRVFNPLTSMDRKMRQYLTYKGKQLIEIDTANSQPLLLVHELKKANHEVEDELVKILEDGTFYELFTKEGKTRDQIKVSVFSFMYATEIKTDHEIYKILNERFPKFTKSLQEFTGRASLSRLLQSIESNIWIDIISAAAMFAGINHATIHDSIVFPGDETTINEILDIIDEAFGNIKPKLHIRTLDGQEIKFTRTPSDKMKPFISKARKFKFVFWQLNERGNYIFDHFKTMEYLQSIGIYRYYTNNLNYILIRIIDKIVDIIDISSIKHLIIDYVDEVGNQKVKNDLGTQIEKLITDKSLQSLKPKKINFFRGEEDTIYVLYSDAIAKIDVTGINKIHYKDFRHYVWRSTILKRKHPDFSIDDGKTGEFEIFFNNIIKETANRDYVRQVFGYTLQRYRKISNLKAIIITDDNIDDSAKGGTGKGIIAQALSQFLPMVKENGKSFKPDSTFSYQNLKLGTRLFVIDDIHPYFDITKMFSVLTDGLQIEKKFQQPFFLEPEDLPITLLTSNYGLKGSDDSHKRRRLDIGIDKHYTPQKTPRHEFGHDLFREWEEDSPEWIKFDIFMLDCAHQFITEGIREYHNPNIAVKQFIADTHPDFEDFAENIPMNTWVDKKKLLIDLRELLSIKSFSKTMLTKWLKKFADLKGYTFKNDRNKDTITFSNHPQSD